jgi:hypothetical protein
MSDMRFHRLSVVAILLLTLLAVFVFTKTHPEPKAAPQEVVPINKTSGFRILQASRVGSELTLSIKNTYAKKITAFVLTAGNDFRITEDFITAEAPNEVGIQPQQTFTRTYPLPSDQSNPTVILQAVVLDDKTGDGDSVIFEDVRDTRLGHAVQVKRALKILERYAHETPNVDNLQTEMTTALNRPQLETLAAVKTIRPEGTINRKSPEALSGFVEEGLAAGRADVLRKLDEAKASRDKHDYLLKMKLYYETLLDRL